MRYILLLVLLTSTQAFADIDLVKVVKSKNRMYLLEKSKVIASYHVAFGDNPKGHKQQEGDEKTPEGLYTLDYANENSMAYRSMHISYPNQQDKLNAKQRGVSPGGDIMVHGQVNNYGWLAAITQRFNWTNGCIALTNEEMDEFMTLVKVGTPIEITW